jgi:hypothetical protein
VHAVDIALFVRLQVGLRSVESGGLSLGYSVRILSVRDCREVSGIGADCRGRLSGGVQSPRVRHNLREVLLGGRNGCRLLLLKCDLGTCGGHQLGRKLEGTGNLRRC